MAKGKGKKANKTSDADERVTVKTPIFRVTYLGLPDMVKRKNKDTGEEEMVEQYQVTAMFDNDTNLEKLDDLALDTLREKFGKKAVGEDYAMPLLDGDKRARKKGQSLFEGTRYCNLKSNWPFIWLDVDGNEIDLSDKSELYAGITARAVISAYHYSGENEGVSFNIVTMQKIADGEEIAMGGVNKEQARELFDDDVAKEAKAKNKGKGGKKRDKAAKGGKGKGKGGKKK